MQEGTNPRTRATGARTTLLAMGVASAVFFAGASTTRTGAGVFEAPRRNAAVDPIRYDRDVRPILSDRCFACHGPDPGKRRAELRLDTAEGATEDRDGLFVVAPGDPAASELLHRVGADDPADRMPPPDSAKRPLTRDEIEILRRWIAEGAEYEPHWSFVPPRRSPLPSPPSASPPSASPPSASAATPAEATFPASASDPAGAIDAFVSARLRSEGFEPSPPADDATLVRRLFLVLTGLPPTPEDQRAYGADPRADRWERLVDRLLHEPPWVDRYAEHMTVGWLDAARYADTSGLHTDAGRQSWKWRDWVLAAFRDGMPYDRFLTEQIAGDRLPDATLDQRIATGFLRNHVTTDEGGAIPEEYLVEYAIDRASTTASAFLGITMGCARCHDHKFDPISQEEFYRFYAFFDSNDGPGLYSQQPDPNRALEPFLEVPSESQARELARLESDLAEARAALDAPIEGELEAREAWLAALLAETGARWVDAEIVEARSEDGTTLALDAEGAVAASGANPDSDRHAIELVTGDDAPLRWISLEALPGADGRIGRAPNGNAVLESVRAEAISVVDPSRRQVVRFVWAAADVEQADGEYAVVHALADDGRGWAVDGHRVEGPRHALFLADRPFGFEGGTRVVVHLDYDSPYVRHAFARVRIALGALDEAGLDRLAVASTGWYATATFRASRGEDPFDAAFGPESMEALDTGLPFGDARHRFNRVPAFLDGRRNTEFAAGVGATYVARRLFVPSARRVDAAIGSDDGFRLYRNGRLVAERRVDRGLELDQDRVALELDAGEHTIVFKIVNTGGPAGFAWRTIEDDEVLDGPLVAALAPMEVRRGSGEGAWIRAWRSAFAEDWRARSDRVAALETSIETLRETIPRTMVMRERAEPRHAFVLVRGAYDHPDLERPVGPGVPTALGPPLAPLSAPRDPGATERPGEGESEGEGKSESKGKGEGEGERALDRRALARWLTDPRHPLTARVAVNRLWRHVFGAGLVETAEDFGMQGAWPSHPELLDWLAVEFRESGWDVKALVRGIVTSATFRQSSRVRPDLRERDPRDRWLGRFPRRRLRAETIRDQALFVSGLLRESFGGPSVKPYQPPGLWREVAMPASNTRTFERGPDDELWRRSVYTYWKRAAPPPSMTTFDAPTRESCTIRRSRTATPLQALVLFNDVQFVEAARVLAERTLLESGPDAARLARMFARCTGETPEADELRALGSALDDFRARYGARPDDARALLAVGEAPSRALGDRSTLAPEEVAAWTLVANAILSLDSTLSLR